MRMKHFGGLLAGVLLAALWGTPVQAAETPQFEIQMDGRLEVGQMNDGYRIGQGRIAHYGHHLGFQVWRDGGNSAQRPNRYELIGQRNANHKLRIRIEKAGWVPDSDGGKGVILHSGEYSAVFNIVLDGNQYVSGDSYPILLQGGLILGGEPL
ncbi:AfaD family invasin [Serratia odorifera]|uniref:AfaD family invasin n=1 Tax=Serratia odorifera TaxID=618 RepID=UPI0018E7D0B2|nr:AfaD family invasin [Serratia odorifera]MBJ2066812.1 hypothetical protein [Serratia odorifera]